MAHVDYLSRHPISKVTFAPFEEVIPSQEWQPIITVVEGRDRQKEDLRTYQKRRSEAVTVLERDLGREAIPVYEGPSLSTEVW